MEKEASRKLWQIIIVDMLYDDEFKCYIFFKLINESFSFNLKSRDGGVGSERKRER